MLMVDRRRFLIISATLASGALALYLYLTYSRLGSEEMEEYGYSVVADELVIPWSIAVLDEGVYLVTERIGRLTLINRGRVSSVKEFNVYTGGEAGLLGLALDPEFNANRYIYLYMSYKSGVDVFNRVVRYRFNPASYSLDEGRVIIDGIPGSNIHNGGRIRFGPDNYLYITTGDASNPGYSQDINSLGGKILRVGGDGSIPKDNPFNNPVYSYGHRNPQGIDWHPVTGVLVESEHGPIGHDEINHIIRGGNYGWPDVVGSGGDKYIPPIYETGESTIAPSGSSFIDSELFIGYRDWFAVACLRGEMLALFNIDMELNVVDVKRLFRGVFGRLRDVVVDSDGSLLILTSNRDGRGSPRPGDDKVIKVYPG